MMYNIYAGVGEANYLGTVNCDSNEEADCVAREAAIDEYDSYAGLHGIPDRGDIYDSPEDFGLEDGYSEEDVDEVLQEEIDSWIEYYAILEDEDTNIDEEEKHLLYS